MNLQDIDFNAYNNFVSNFQSLIYQYGSLAISKKEFYKYVEYADCIRLYIEQSAKITKAEKLRSKCIKNRDLEVVYFTGKSGSGKTTAAKYYAEQSHYNIFVSGSGDDPLDGYDFEECLILDDFRAGSMRFQELLKFLDNNTESSVKSRYYNKTLSNCKLIIITSVVEPNDLYNFFQEPEGPKEPIEQFYRRLKHHYFKIEDDGNIAEYSLTVDEISLPTYKIYGNMNDIYKSMGIDPTKADDKSIMDNFCTKVEEPENIEEPVKESFEESDESDFISLCRRRK